jgi:fatty-acyl-CoA synthase
MVMGNLGCTSHGATMVIPAPGFDPAITLQTIEDVQVVGVPDEKYGEELCAWIKMKDAGSGRRRPLDAEAVREFATGKLAHYKIPRYVLVVDEFPMTVTGKIRKVEMREESARRLGLS